jgi:hypothetical protein
LIDSTGIKVKGEGEWNARKHGGTKRRVWRKIHIGINEQTLEIRAAEFTTSDVGDAPMLPNLLDQIPPDQEIASVTADGAFDTRKCHGAIAARGAAAIIPPRNCQAVEARHPRSHRAQRGTSVEPSGDDGAAIIDGAASRPRCTASNCWANASWRGTSTVRSPSSRSVWPS